MAEDPEEPFVEEDAAEEPSPNPNAADPDHQRRVARGAARSANESMEFWRGVLGSEIGRREMYAIIATMHFDKERWVESSNGAPWREATWAEAGIQRVGFQLYRKWLGLAPDETAVMLRENDPALQPAPKPKRRPRRPEFPWNE